MVTRPQELWLKRLETCATPMCLKGFQQLAGAGVGGKQGRRRNSLFRWNPLTVTSRGHGRSRRIR